MFLQKQIWSSASCPGIKILSIVYYKKYIKIILKSSMTANSQTKNFDDLI